LTSRKSALDGLAQQILRVRAGKPGKDVAQIPAQFRLALDDDDIKSLVGDGERGGHACQASTHYQCPVVDLESLALDRPQQGSLGHRHANQVLRLDRCHLST
jgi:hypothetical protein